jgi:hypothetical protein
MAQTSTTKEWLLIIEQGGIISLNKQLYDREYMQTLKHATTMMLKRYSFSKHFVVGLGRVYCELGHLNPIDTPFIDAISYFTAIVNKTIDKKQIICFNSAFVVCDAAQEIRHSSTNNYSTYVTKQLLTKDKIGTLDLRNTFKSYDDMPTEFKEGLDVNVI